MVIDSHCHLDDDQFSGDVDAVIQRAKDAGVAAIITAGTDVESSRVAVNLAERHEGVYAVVGIHPHRAQPFDADVLRVVRDLAQHPQVVGIGEIGLDFHYKDGAPREVQEILFSEQLALSIDLNKPAVIHDRDAHDAVLNVIAKYAGSARGILHCFSGDLKMAQRAIDLGYYISFAGNLTFRNAAGLREMARVVPLDRIVIETDSPFLSPHPYRGRRNEPSNVMMVAAKLAETKNISLDQVMQTTMRNCESLFNLYFERMP